MFIQISYYFCGMKTVVKFILVIFVFFLSTPTIVSLIEKNCDTSVFYNMSEEEHVHHKEVKAEMKNDFCYVIPTVAETASSLIHSENLSKHDNISASIFIPPPDQV